MPTGRAVLFDSDGVLMDTERVFFDETRLAFASAGIDITRAQWSQWYLADAIGLPAADCLAVEDSPRGACAAHAAGIACVVVPTPLTDTALCPPDCRVLPDIRGLVELPDRKEE